MPSERWLNLIYYFAVRNMDKKARDEFDGQLAEVNARWTTELARKQLTQSSSDAQGSTREHDVDSTEPSDETQQRKRRLPPKPSWYGTNDRAVESSIAVAKSLSSRDGRSGSRR